MAGVLIKSAVVGISGNHIYSVNSSGVVPISSGQVTYSDIKNALASARAITVPDGHQILHVLPQYFIVDNQDRVLDPHNMHGKRLEVHAHIIIGSIASIRNIITCCHMANIPIHDIVLEQLASSYAVLTPDERDLGVGVLDIGGGTTDFALYQHNSIVHTKVFPIAGMHFTRDLAIGLQTTIEQAEKMKKEYGDLAIQDLQHRLTIRSKEQDQPSNLTHAMLTNILQARAQELVQFIKEEIDTQNLSHYLIRGLVLTGGGSLLKGLDTYLQTALNIPIRVGNPYTQYNIPDLLKTPIYATAYGLLVHSMKQDHENIYMHESLYKRVLEKMKSWVSEIF